MIGSRMGLLSAVRGSLTNTDRRVAVSLALLVTFGTLLFSEGAITGSDGRSMYEVARSIVDHGTLTVDSSLGVQGRNGAYYSRYGLGLPLIAVVGYAVFKPLASNSIAPDLIEQAGVGSMMPVICGILVVVLYCLARRIGATRRSSSYVSIGAVIGTFLLPYTKEFFSEPLTALFLTLAIERGIAERPLGAGVAAGLAGLTRPQAFALAPILAWRAYVGSGWKGVMRFVAPITLVLCVTLWYNWKRFGSASNMGYEGYGFSTSPWIGSFGLLLYPAKSILLFAPIVLVLPPALARLFRLEPTAFWLLSSNLLLVFLTAATWVSWSGGWAWGPRLLITGIAPAVAAIAPWIDGSFVRRRIAIGLLLCGGLVSLPALIVSTRAQQLDLPPPAVGPGVVRQYELILPTLRYTENHLFDYERGTNRQYLSLWQVGAVRILGKRGMLLAVLLSFILFVGAVSSLLSLRRSLNVAREGDESGYK